MVGEQRKSRNRFALNEPAPNFHPVNRHQVNTTGQSPEARNTTTAPRHLLPPLYRLSPLWQPQDCTASLIARAYRIPKPDKKILDQNLLTTPTNQAEYITGSKAYNLTHRSRHHDQIRSPRT